MSYQVLARKWRPGTFSEMVGQQHVLKALSNALDHDRLHHAYLFSGTRGVGKTTVARILAKCLNCERGVSSQPCGMCSACQEVAEGRSVDLIEVDAASRTKVDDTRELLDNVQYAPTRSRFKIYLIDEVHMLSTHSFNALLKTLEEPPPHVKFLLATTDPQKLPATVLSRCLQFNLKNMPPEQVAGHLRTVLEAEGVRYDESALRLLGRAADGSMRDALSLTDQAIGYGGGQIAEAEVRAMLGVADRTAILQLLDGLSRDDARAVLQTVASMAESGADFSSAVDELIATLHELAVVQVVPDAEPSSADDPKELRRLAALLTGEDVQLHYQMALNGKRDMAISVDTRSAFEMIMLRMLAFRPLTASAPVAVDAGPAAPGSGPVATTSETPPVASSALQRAPERPVAPASPPAAGNHSAGEVGDRGKKPEAPRDGAEIDWADLLPSLGLTGSTLLTAKNCEWYGQTADTVELRLDPAQSNLFNARHVERIEKALRKSLGRATLKVSIQPGQLRSETPAQREHRQAREQHEAAVAQMREDPRLSALIARFSATLDEPGIEITVNRG
ncbi:MAG: DNA polymerase III subunit gamma/tau [Chromatocurvus sp.]